MYGTVARLQLKPGSRDALEAQMDEFEAVRVPGWVSTTIYASDDDSSELWMAVVFESREAYRANAESSAQHERFLKMRELLAADPEWHDGQVLRDEHAS
jgi:quinol monooxygenase YgiN